MSASCTSATVCPRCSRSRIGSPCCATAGARGRSTREATTEPELVDLIVGRPFEAAFPPPSSETGESREVLVVDGLQGQSFGPVSFTLKSGEIVGIAGAEGNGQPQLFDCLAGRQPPKAGRVVCDGKELMLTSTHEAVRSRDHAAAGRPQARGADAGARGRVNATIQIAAPVQRARLHPPARGARDGRGIGRAARDPHAIARATRPVPLRWQPAEGRGRAYRSSGSRRSSSRTSRRRASTSAPASTSTSRVAHPDRCRNRPAREVERPSSSSPVSATGCW